MASNSKPVLILVGQTPPPYNGQNVMIEVLRAGLSGRYPLKHIRMSYSGSIGEVGKLKVSKVWKLFALIRDTRRELKKNPEAILYYPPASPNLIPVIRDLLYLLCVRHLAGRVVYHYHAYGLAEFLGKRPGLSKLARLVYGKADLSVVPTASCRKDPVFLQSKRTETIPYGRNLPAAEGIQREPYTGPLKVLFVGIHTEGKGIFDLIETARELKEHQVPFHIRCAGMWIEEKERIQAEAMILRYGLKDFITLLGNCVGDALWQEYKEAGVLFFPTKYMLETQGMVVVEAMAFGLPVVSSRWRGPKDVVVDGETGFLCEPGSIKAYADALTELQGNPEKRIAMGAAGRKQYENFYTEERYIQCWMELLDEVWRA